MKILLFWCFYQKYVDRLYAFNPHLADLSYQEQLNIMLLDYFGWVPALLKRLEETGCTVEIIIVNAMPHQKAWAKENGYAFSEQTWQYDIPMEQVKSFKPDAILVAAMPQYYGNYLNNLRPYCRKIFAWIASPVTKNLDLAAVDCILTSHQNFQEYFRQQGKQCEILLPAFEPKILNSVPSVARDIKCSFIGSLSYMHLQRMEVIRALVDRTPIQIWSDLPKLISRGLLDPKFVQNYLKMGKIRSRNHPSVWGVEMYTVLARSEMTVNIHVDAAGGLAGNIRMFEATGMGALLITEAAPNIQELYQPGIEIVTYENTHDLVEKIEHYISHPEERAKIAKAGQEKTLAVHSTVHRSQQLLNIFDRYL
jgi:spore maturation protein CgeB